MSANINADFVHYGNRFRAHEAGFRARAFYFEALSMIMPQQTFNLAGLMTSSLRHPRASLSTPLFSLGDLLQPKCPRFAS
jgi:hypothetical protein